MSRRNRTQLEAELRVIFAQAVRTLAAHEAQCAEARRNVASLRQALRAGGWKPPTP